MLWGRRVLVLGAVLVFVLPSLAFSIFQERVYKAEAIVRVMPQTELSSGQDAEPFVDSVFRVVNTEEFHSEVMRQARWGEDAARFEQRQEVQTFARQDGEDAGLLIQFSAPDAEVAARAANTYAALFVERVEQLNDRLVGGSVAATASVQSRAAPPEQPSRPRPLLYTLVAAAVGLLAGGALALSLESRTQSWRGVRDAELTLQAPVLGLIPDYSPQEEEEV